MLPHGEISNQFTKEHLELMINATAACAMSSKRVYKPLLTVCNINVCTFQQHGEGLVVKPTVECENDGDFERNKMFRSRINIDVHWSFLANTFKLSFITIILEFNFQDVKNPCPSYIIVP